MNMERAKLSCKNCKWYVEEEEYVCGKREKVSKCSHKNCLSYYFSYKKLAYMFSNTYCSETRGVDGACGVEAKCYEDNLKNNKETLCIVRYSYNDAYMFKVCSKDELIEEFRKVSKCAICDDYDFNVEYTKVSNNDKFLVIGTINQNFGRVSAGFVGFDVM